MKAIPTKFAGPCAECGKFVPSSGPQRGVAVKGEAGWTRYCKDCSPVKIDRKITKNGMIIMPYEPESLDLITSIPGAYWDKSCWRVSLKMAHRQRLLEVADQLQLDVDPALREVQLEEQAQTAAAKGLYPFQVTGVDWLSKGNKRLLADDMGLGKTIQTLMCLDKAEAALAVVPSAVKYNWQQEAQKWRDDLRISVVETKKGFRLPFVGELLIVTYDMLPEWAEPKKPGNYVCLNKGCSKYFTGHKEYGKCPTCQRVLGKSKPWHENTYWPSQKMRTYFKDNVVLIGDEVQKVKNPRTVRSKRFRGLAMDAKKVIGLTGTPLENRQEDLFGVLKSLRMERFTFGGWKKYLKYMNGRRNQWGGFNWGKPQPIVPELLRRVMLRRTRGEVLPDLPKKQVSTLKVDCPSNLIRKMDKLWEEYHTLLEEDMELPPFEEFSTIRRQLAESRIETTKELVAEHEENNIPLVIFSCHRKPLEELAKRDGWEKITGGTSPKERQRICQAFQNGELKGVAVSIRAGGVGLNLTYAWKGIFIDLDWVPGQNHQAQDRLCRIGQESDKVEIVHMVSNHVLDQHVVDLIQKKIEIIEAATMNKITPFNEEEEPQKPQKEKHTKQESVGDPEIPF